MILFLFSAFVLTLVSGTIVDVFIGKNFKAAKDYIFLLSFALAFDSCRYMVINYFYYFNKTYISAAIFFLIAILNIVLNYFLILKNGAIGAAQATFIAMLLNFLLTWLASYFIIRMPWMSKKVFQKIL